MTRKFRNIRYELKIYATHWIHVGRFAMLPDLSHPNSLLFAKGIVKHLRTVIRALHQSLPLVARSNTQRKCCNTEFNVCSIRTQYKKAILCQWKDNHVEMVPYSEPDSEHRIVHGTSNILVLIPSTFHGMAQWYVLFWTLRLKRSHRLYASTRIISPVHCVHTCEVHTPPPSDTTQHNYLPGSPYANSCTKTWRFDAWMCLPRLAHMWLFYSIKKWPL